jgi:hypothetical protein
MKSLNVSTALLNSMSKVPSSDTTNTTLLTQLWNDSVKTICSIRSGKWWFLQTLTTIATVASQQGYAIPARVRKIIDVYVTVGATVYTPRPVYSPEAWNRVLAAQLGESDVPRFYFIQDNKILIAPTPSSTAGTISVRGRKSIPDYTVDDDTVTVTAIANGDTTVTVTAGALVSMAGKYLRIAAPATGAANAGDGQWYEIASATVGTTIELVAPYEGVTIAAGTATATVADVTPIPEAYDMAPIYRTMALFTQINDPTSTGIINTYWKLYDGGQEAGLSTLVGGLIGQMLEAEGESIEGAYVAPMGTGDQSTYAPYYEPYQDATGF